MPKTVLGTTVKLNDSNYLLWARAFRIGAQNKFTHLLEFPPAATYLTYTTWLLETIMWWLLNSMKEKISGSVMFLTTKVMYENKKNSSWVFEIYERLFELKQGDWPVPKFYRELKG